MSNPRGPGPDSEVVMMKNVSANPIAVSCYVTLLRFLGFLRLSVQEINVDRVRLNPSSFWSVGCSFVCE